MWDLLVGEACVGTVGLAGDGLDGEVDGELVKKMMMLQAAFEKEVHSLGTVGMAGGFWGVSRVMEWILLRRLESQVKGKSGMEGRFYSEEERYRRTKGRERRQTLPLHH